MKHSATFVLLMAALLVFTNYALAHSSQGFPQINVSVGKKVLTLEYANTAELREHGLQHKRVLCDDCGMLIEYEQTQVAALSTKDIFLPLDIAFIGADGKIVRILQMLPFEEEEQSSKVPVRYVVEMNRGWFKRQRIKVGDKVSVVSPQT